MEASDNGSNVKAAFKDQSWLGCCGNNLNLVLSHAFEIDESNGDMTEVLQLLTVCKNTVRYAKKSRVQQQLETTLKPAVATR